ncbi:MAG: DoxX family protein [Planctomycetes bacterium]|nr:DoxX family protein [Planctomycetota bacterium]
MSDKTSTNGTSSQGGSCATATCCAWKFAAALLLLRLCLGTHFFSEGTKKLLYDEARQQWSLNPEFTAKTEIVFRNATGPLAGFFKSQLPGFYDWENLLAVPKQAMPLSAEELYKRQDWQADYAARRKTAAKEKNPLPIEFPEYAPYKAWAEKIVAGLRSKLKTFTDLSGISDEQDAEAAEVFLARHQQLADLLSDESQAIEDYQHELWRQQNMEATGGSDEIPFRKKRLAAKQSETKGLGGRLVSVVRGIETSFNNDLRSVLTAEQREDVALVSQIEKTLTPSESRRLRWLNIGVTSLIIGVGVCLLLGLFTRLAAAGAILFLLSVMVTQLPWVPGARADFFYYQLVECAALLALAACSPWRLPGIDYLLRGLCNKCCTPKR